MVARLLVGIAVALLAPVAGAAEVVDWREDGPAPSTVASETWERVFWRWGNTTHGLVDDAGEVWCEPTTGGCDRLFTEAGEFRYHCPLHPDEGGRVLVESRGGEQASSVRAAFLVAARGLSVTFDASRLARSLAAIESYSWDLGDGAAASGPVVEHAYARPGRYVVELRVVDEFGKQTRAIETVRVLPNADPLATFRVSGEGRTLLFEADPHEGSHAWDFGDGAPDPWATLGSTPTSVVHVYRRGGEFLVDHTFTSANNSTHRALAPVRVAAEETFGWEAEGLGLTVDASRLPTYANASFAWRFGDGGSAEGARVTHAFSAPGLWSVALVLTDQVGAQTLEREGVLTRATPGILVAASPETSDASSRDVAMPIVLLFAAGTLALLRAPERYK